MMKVESEAALAIVAGSVAIACASSDAASPSAPRPGLALVVDDRDAIPCGPRAVLEAVCQRCHARPPLQGAPFPLVTRSDVVRVSADGAIWQLMIAQLEAGRMPLTPVELDDASKGVLLEWLRTGAVAGDSRTCTDAGSSDAAASTDEAGSTSGASP